MDAKLTLKLDKAVIEQAKSYAKEQETSLSRLIENYLSVLTSKEKKLEDTKLSPLVKSLSGSVKVAEDFDFDKTRFEYLSEKYK